MRENKAITFSASDQVKSNLMVSSHERSGTHFLINSIALNSAYTSNPEISYDPWASGNIVNFQNFASVRNFFEMLSHNNCNSVIKNHFHADYFFDSRGNSALASTKVIYILRDPIEVLASFRRFIRHLNDKGHREGPIAEDRLTFMLAEPVGNMMRYQSRQHETIIERWIEHATAWRKAATETSNVRIVRYGDLKDDFDVTVSGLLEFIGQPRLQNLRRPDPKKNTVFIPNNESLSSDERRHLTSCLRRALPAEATSKFDELLSFLEPQRS